jgi:hypothetical protein
MITWFAGQPLGLKIVLPLLVILLLVFLFRLLWLLWLRQYLEWGNVKTLEIEKRVGLKIEFIKTAAQILGGIFFLVTIYVAWQNMDLTKEKNRSDLYLAQEKQTTDLFVQAIKQLGGEKLEVRLGGIYALERIARDSAKDHGPIMEVLTAYVRENAPWPRENTSQALKKRPWTKKGLPLMHNLVSEEGELRLQPDTDIQAILTVIGRLGSAYGKGQAQRLDLRKTDLEGADLREAHLEKAHLEQANLSRSRLEGAKLGGTRLDLALLIGAHLERALLNEAYLERAALVEVRLDGAVLRGAHLKGTTFIGAHLKGANLAGTDLRQAQGLTKEQIESAIIDKNTKLPDNLKPAGPDKAKPQ